MSSYPGAVDVFPINRSDSTAMATTHAADHNNADDAINKIEAELGTSPSGSYATLLARLDAMQALIDVGSVTGPTCLAGALYDPGTAATNASTSLLAMTALDTSNLRLTFTAPTNGIVQVRMRCCTHGSAVSPMILLGVLDGATVRGRMAPASPAPSGAGNQRHIHEAQFLVTGLTPSTSYTWDAAYAVQVVQASSAVKYGGPNDASSDNSFGAFSFSVWSTPNLLGGKLYDPGTAATVSTAALSALAVIDTSNLRLTFTAPASGKVLVRMQTLATGATGTRPSVLLGVLDGTTVRGRIAGGSFTSNASTAAASDHYMQTVSFLVPGLTPSQSYTWDAAWGVELALAATTLSWGGPNDTTGNNAWGGFAYEIWAA